MRQKITCPETAHLEEIEFDESPEDGRVLGIRSCSRFQPHDRVDCDGLCAHRMNERMNLTPLRPNPGEDAAGDEAAE